MINSLQFRIHSRRIPVAITALGVIMYGSPYEKTTTLACVVFFIIEWILFKKICSIYYYTGKWFATPLQIALIGVMMWGGTMVLIFLGYLNESMSMIWISVTILIAGIIFLPVIISTIILYLYSDYTLASKLFLCHPRLRNLLGAGSALTQYTILLCTPDAVSYSHTSHLLIKQRVELGLISPVVAVVPKYRNTYTGIIGASGGLPTLIVDHESDTGVMITLGIRTQGNLIPEDLFSSKLRAKIIEALQLQGRYVRAIDYNDQQRKLSISVYGDTIHANPQITELIHAIDYGFTVLGIHNQHKHYPVFKECTPIDTHPDGIIYTVKCVYFLPKGLSPAQISKQKLEELNSFVRKPLYEHTIKPYEDTIELYIQLAKRDLSLMSYLDFAVDQSLRVPVGFDLKYRRPVYANFDESTVQSGDYGFAPHYIIAGSTGSGKSSFIRYFLAQLLRVHTPETLRLFLVDPKVVSFSMFKQLPHLYAPIVSQAQKVTKVLDGILEEVEKRYQLLAEYEVENILQLRSRYPELAIPTILIIIDEFADILDSHEFARQEKIILQLKRIGQKARAAGVHCILMTQRATSTNIDGEIKANFAGRIAFKVAGEGDSHVMLGHPDAASIETPGECFALLGEAEMMAHVQVPYVSADALQKRIQGFAHLKQEYCDQSLSNELLKQPLDPKMVTYKHLGTPHFPYIPLGIDCKTHAIQSICFAKVNDDDTEPTPHTIISGATNSGKSQCAKLLIVQLMRSGTPQEVQLVLIDPKVVSFSYFDGMPHLYRPVVTKHDQLLPVLEELLKEITYRYERFAQYHVEHITQRNQEVDEKLPAIVIVIDEFADLLNAYDYSGREKIEKLLKRFGQMARAAGIYMVLLTQRANSANIPGEIRTHFAGRIGFRMNTEADSFYILEESGAEKITGAGHFMMKTPADEIMYGYVPLLGKQRLQEFRELVTTYYTSL